MKKIKQSKEVKLSAPWDIYFSKMKALFDRDPEVSVDFNRDNYEIVITSTNDDKIDAIRQIVPETVPMGNITLTIKFKADVPSSPADLYKRAFKGNPAYVGSETYPLPTGENAYFAEFADLAVHYYADDLSNPEGLQFMLYQDIAREILNHDDIFITSVSSRDSW